MTNDTKYSGTMANDTKNIGVINNANKFSGSIVNDIKSVNSSLIGEIKYKVIFLVTQALDFLMTEDNDYLVVSKGGEMTNDIKL